MDTGEEAEKGGDGSRNAGPGTKSGRRWKSGNAGRSVQVEYQAKGRRRLGSEDVVTQEDCISGQTSIREDCKDSALRLYLPEQNPKAV